MPKLGNTLKARVFGVTFLALCVLFVYMTYAVFTKKFTPYDEVTLQSSKIGLSLPARADVKVRGVIVGEVLETVTDGDGAKLTLGLFPDMRESVPADVTGRILPKTLFGEKYVSLEVPDGEATGAEPIEVGAVIKQAEVAVEVEEVLNDLFPLLRAVRPGDLNVTLNAIATALEGRGDKLGEGLETFNSYLGKLNPEIPALVESLDQLGQVSAVYEDVVPELARLLRNTVKTTQTFESEADRIEVLFDDVAGFADTTRGFLEKNGDNIITLSDAGVSGSCRCWRATRPSTSASCAERWRASRRTRAPSATRPCTSSSRRCPSRAATTPATSRSSPTAAGRSSTAATCTPPSTASTPRSACRPASLTSPQIRDGVNYPLGKRVAVGDAVIGTQEQKDVIDLAAAAAMQRPVNEVPDVATLLIGSLAQGKGVTVR